ncbi:hypothetical protein FOZ63_015449, partial [Perkinsus olseni]
TCSTPHSDAAIVADDPQRSHDSVYFSPETFSPSMSPLLAPLSKDAIQQDRSISSSCHEVHQRIEAQTLDTLNKAKGYPLNGSSSRTGQGSVQPDGGSNTPHSASGVLSVTRSRLPSSTPIFGSSSEHSDQPVGDNSSVQIIPFNIGTVFMTGTVVPRTSKSKAVNDKTGDDKSISKIGRCSRRGKGSSNTPRDGNEDDKAGKSSSSTEVNGPDSQEDLPSTDEGGGNGDKAGTSSSSIKVGG